MMDFAGVLMDQFVYSLYEQVAVGVWFIIKGFLWAAYFLMELTAWISTSVLSPLISTTFQITGGLLLPIVTLAALVLAIGYFLSVFGDYRFVDAQSGFMWLLIGAFIFTVGPNFYMGIEDFRRSWGGAFYESGLDQATVGASSISGVANLSSDTSIQVDPISNLMWSFSSADQWIDGMDVVFAYTLSDPCDMFYDSGSCTIQQGQRNMCKTVTNTDCDLPWQWYSSAYFPMTEHSAGFEFMTPEDRDASLAQAARGLQILMTALPMAIFAVLEQLINFMLALSMGVAYLSMGVAILFAFFKRTEPITWSVVNLIIELFLQSVMSSLLLSLIVTLLVISTGFGNGALMIGASIIGLVLVAVLLKSAVNSLASSVDRMFGAMSSATGNTMGKVSASLGSAAGMAGNAAGAGMILARGGSAAQAAGMALSGNRDLVNAARNASYLFGTDSPLGQMSNEIYQGAAAGDLFGGPIGGAFMPIDQKSRPKGGAAFDEEGNPLRPPGSDNSGGSGGGSGGSGSGGNNPAPSGGSDGTPESGEVWREAAGIEKNATIQTSGKVKASRPLGDDSSYYVDPNRNDQGVSARSELPSMFPLNAVDDVVFKEGREPSNLNGGSLVRRDDLQSFKTQDGYSYTADSERPNRAVARNEADRRVERATDDDVAEFGDEMEREELSQRYPNLYPSARRRAQMAENAALDTGEDGVETAVTDADTDKSLEEFRKMSGAMLPTTPSPVYSPHGSSAEPEYPPISDSDYEAMAAEHGSRYSADDMDDFSDADVANVARGFQAAMVSSPPAYSPALQQEAAAAANNLMAAPEMIAPNSPESAVYQAATALGLADEPELVARAMTDVTQTGQISNATTGDIVQAATFAGVGGSGGSIGNLNAEVAALGSALGQMANAMSSAANVAQSAAAKSAAASVSPAVASASPASQAMATGTGDLAAAVGGSDGGAVAPRPGYVGRKRTRTNTGAGTDGIAGL